MKKLFTWFVLVLSLMMVISGCGNQTKTEGSASKSSSKAASSEKSKSDEQVTLRFMWWGDQTRSQLTQQAIDLFEKAHPNIKIEPEFSGIDGYFDKLDTEFAAGNAPDIIQFGGNLNDYVGKGVILPLNKYEGKELDVSKHPKSMLDFATINNKLYGVCLGVNAWGVLINKTDFEKANVPLPSDKWTWKDYEDTAKKVTNGLDKKKYGTLAFTEDGFGIYLAQKDKYPYINNKIDFKENDIQDWFQMWQDMRKSGAAAPAEIQAQNQQDPAQSAIIKGNVSMQLIPSNQFGAYSALSKDKFELHIVPNTSGKNGVALLPSQFLAGNAKTKHPKEVAEFLNFFVNDIKAGAALGMNRGIPVNPDVRDQLTASASDQDKEVLSYIDYVTKTSKALAHPNFPGYTEEQKLYQETEQNISFNKESVKQASQDYFDQLQQIVKRNTAAK